MGYIEQTIIDWISEDGERLHDFIAVLGDQIIDEVTIEALREKLSGLVPACGKFWQDLLLAAIAEADWEEIATQLTDRRETHAKESAWLMVDRRKV
jgi:hypothetical protein